VRACVYTGGAEEGKKKNIYIYKFISRLLIIFKKVTEKGEEKFQKNSIRTK